MTDPMTKTMDLARLMSEPKKMRPWRLDRRGEILTRYELDRNDFSVEGEDVAVHLGGRSERGRRQIRPPATDTSQ